ncbi:MAG: RimK family alpha-L-glutamate ligase [Parvularculaceae bacterium]
MLRLWAILQDEAITDDRAYLLGYLKSAFDDVMTTRAARTADAAPPPSRRPDVVLNLVSSRSRALLADIDAKAAAYGAAVSSPSQGAWRTEDKRTYLEDFPDVSPPTVVAKDFEAVRAAWAAFGGDVVVKDAFGDRGRGVERISTEDELSKAEAVREAAAGETRDLIVQPYLSGFSRGDKRVVLQRTPDDDFKIIAAIERRPPPGGWKSNLRAGGQAFRTDLTDEEAAFALALAPRAGIDKVGLDIATHDDRLYYLEHIQGYGGIVDYDLDRGVTGVALCAAFLRHLAEHGRPKAARPGGPSVLGA